MNLDDIDKRIISALQVDGRMPYSQLASLIDLSEAATRQRVNRLIDKGIMSIVAVTDPVALGHGCQALVGIQVDSSATQIAEKFSQMDELDYVVVTAGRYDVVVELVCTDLDHLLRIVDEKVRTVDGVRTAEILTYLSLVKQVYNWGTG